MCLEGSGPSTAHPSPACPDPTLGPPLTSRPHTSVPQPRGMWEVDGVGAASPRAASGRGGDPMCPEGSRTAVGAGTGRRRALTGTLGRLRRGSACASPSHREVAAPTVCSQGRDRTDPVPGTSSAEGGPRQTREVGGGSAPRRQAGALTPWMEGSPLWGSSPACCPDLPLPGWPWGWLGWARGLAGASPGAQGSAWEGGPGP